MKFPKAARFFLFLFWGILWGIKALSPVWASNEFIVSHRLSYHFQEDGTCQSTYQITLENKLSNIYATQYAVTIDGNHIQNIDVRDEKGEKIKFDISQPQRRLTKITVYLSDKKVGKGKKQTFTIHYQTPDYSQKEGQIWRITTPKISDLDKIDSLILSIEAPISFGKLSFVSPQSYQYQQKENSQVIQFNKAALGKGEVMAVFGESQTFEFLLKYYLKNSFSQEKKYSIALPPDTNYQRIYLHQITPTPENVILDEDGNWLAIFSLSPHQEINILARGKAQISANPAPLPLSNNNMENYLKEQTYWEKNDPQIKQEASKLKTAKAIYQFVVEKLTYDMQRVQEKDIQRLGAKKALLFPDRAICSEFTDLFIALCRAASIPAREINGYAYSNNPQLLPLSLGADILHSWPEFWDNEKKVWRQVDPTWENTSHINYFDHMDMTHLALVVHGQNSQQPLPAGAYRRPEDHQKNVIINFSTPEEKSFPALAIKFEFPQKIAPGQKEKGKIIIQNIGTAAQYRLQLSIKGSPLLADPQEEKIDALLPFGQKTIPVTLQNSYHLFGEKKNSLTVSIKDQKNNIIKEEQTSLFLTPLISLDNLPQLSLISASFLFLLSLLIALLKIKKRK